MPVIPLFGFIGSALGAAGGGAAVATGLGATALAAGGLTAAGLSMADAANKNKKAAAASASAATPDIGNLTGAESAGLVSASKKVFREGLYFTSPTGAYGTGSRGRSRLMGA